MTYNTDNENWQKRLNKVEKTISLLKKNVSKGNSCDKWGQLLKIGDLTDKGIVEK